MNRVEKQQISEISITPIKPLNGLVGFASFVLNNSLFLGSVGIFTRPFGGYRLTYPTKIIGDKQLNIFYPINKDFAIEVEKVIIKEFEEVTKNDRYNGIGF